MTSGGSRYAWDFINALILKQKDKHSPLGVGCVERWLLGCLQIERGVILDASELFFEHTCHRETREPEL